MEAKVCCELEVAVATLALSALWGPVGDKGHQPLWPSWRSWADLGTSPRLGDSLGALSSRELWLVPPPTGVKEPVLPR